MQSCFAHILEHTEYRIQNMYICIKEYTYKLHMVWLTWIHNMTERVWVARIILTTYSSAHTTPAVKAEFASKLCKIRKTLFSLGIVLISEAFVQRSKFNYEYIWRWRQFRRDDNNDRVDVICLRWPCLCIILDSTLFEDVVL